jgi:hypothetical protein
MTDTADSRTYRLLDALDVEAPAGTSLLVSAPEPDGSTLLRRMLREELRDGGDVLTITTDEPAGAIVESLRAGLDGTAVDGLRIIDCQTGDLAVDDDSVVVQDVDTPRNLTDIGIGFANAFDELEAEGADSVRFGLLSLSVVLSYVDRETVYRFCQTLTRGLAQENALGLFLLNVAAHDEETVNTLRRAFDGTVEVDATGANLAVRVVGLDGVSAEWHTVDDA